jgi:phenylacetate-CoA ligase
MNWFDWSLERQGYPIKQATKDLAGLALLDPVAFEARQQTARDAIVAHHLAHTPYYQKLVPSGAQTPWSQLPIMTKADLQTPLKQRLAQGFTPANIHQHKTSGSSGHPFGFCRQCLKTHPPIHRLQQSTPSGHRFGLGHCQWPFEGIIRNYIQGQ